MQYQPEKPQKHIPLIADIYFNSKLAMEPIRQGTDKIKMNPNTIGSIEQIKAVVEEAKNMVFVSERKMGEYKVGGTGSLVVSAGISPFVA